MAAVHIRKCAVICRNCLPMTSHAQPLLVVLLAAVQSLYCVLMSMLHVVLCEVGVACVDPSHTHFHSEVYIVCPIR